MLMIDLQNVKDVYTILEVNGLMLIRSECNIADALTEVKLKCTLLDTVTN